MRSKVGSRFLLTYKGAKLDILKRYFFRTRPITHDDAIEKVCVQLSIVCLLLLRGPQTPGELRARSGRLHTFEDNAAVITAAESLIDREGEPMLIKLPRTAGRKDAEYMHLFSGPVDIEAHRKNAEETQAKSAAPRVSTSDLHDRVTTLEAQVAELKSQIAALQ